MNVLSLFDGISCGQLALQRAGLKVDNYYSSELDKYAISVTRYNFPDTICIGDVTKVSFKNGILYTSNGNFEVGKIDLLIGGSPCTGFSFAGKQLNFNDPQSKLFFDYVRIMNEVRSFNPDLIFLLENVNMATEHKKVITDYMGILPIRINSSLVSAQSRDRFYWTNIGLVKDGLFNELICGIPQPGDLGILLKDVLENGVGLNACEDGKGRTCCARYYKTNISDMFKDNGFSKDSGVALPLNDMDGKSRTIKNQYAKNGMPNFTSQGTFGASGVAESIKVANVNPSGNGMNGNVFSSEGKAPTITTNKGEGTKIVEPICVNSKDENGIQPSLSDRIYNIEGKGTCVTGGFRPDIAEPVILQKGRGFNKGGIIIDKSPSLTSNSWQENNHLVEPTNEPIKGSTIINVKNGYTTLKNGEEIKINLADGYWRIRKLTPIECERLQTVPDNYTLLGLDNAGKEVKVSNSQRYKQLGNGWTVDVIKHIFSFL